MGHDVGRRSFLGEELGPGEIRADGGQGPVKHGTEKSDEDDGGDVAAQRREVAGEVQARRDGRDEETEHRVGVVGEEARDGMRVGPALDVTHEQRAERGVHLEQERIEHLRREGTDDRQQVAAGREVEEDGAPVASNCAQRVEQIAGAHEAAGDEQRREHDAPAQHCEHERLEYPVGGGARRVGEGEEQPERGGGDEREPAEAQRAGGRGRRRAEQELHKHGDEHADHAHPERVRQVTEQHAVERAETQGREAVDRDDNRQRDEADPEIGAAQHRARAGAERVGEGEGDEGHAAPKERMTGRRVAVNVVKAASPRGTHGRA